MRRRTAYSLREGIGVGMMVIAGGLSIGCLLSFCYWMNWTHFASLGLGVATLLWYATSICFMTESEL